MEHNYTYDLVVIGGGPGGYTGAIRAAKLGMRVALIEENQLGGTCLNRGCIPTKTLLHSGELFKKTAEFPSLGIDIGNASVNQDKIYQRKDAIVSSLRTGIESLIRFNKIDFFKKRGVLVDKNTVRAGDEELTTQFILLASGSSPSRLDKNRPIKGIERALSSDDVLSQPIEGKDIVILGGGVIGVEFASYFSSIGKRVTLVTFGDRILNKMSRDLSQQAALSLKKNGVKIINVSAILFVGEGSVLLESEGREFVADGDVIISALGRKANLENLGLENVGLPTEKNIPVNEKMQTKVDNIYACGDIIGRAQLAHFAAASAIVAVEDMLKMPPSIDLSVVPSCIYTSPEIAVCGKREEEVEGARVGKFLMGANGKSIIEGFNRGYVKVIAGSDEVIVGAEVFSVRGSDILGELALAIKNKMKVHEITSLIHPHPTIQEGIGEACEDVFGLATHLKPRS